MAPTKREAIDQVLASLAEMIQRKSRPSSNGKHSQEVTSAAFALGDKALASGRISDSSVPLLKIGAVGHHAVPGSDGSHANAQESARITVEEMEKTGAFLPWEMLAVQEMILATERSDKSPEQSGRDEEIVCLCGILADADLAMRGKVWAEYHRHLSDLWQEVLGEETTLAELKEFLEGELKQLREHRFCTPWARNLYPCQPANVVALEAWIAQLS